MDIREMIARYKKLYTASVYDILDEMGYPNQCLDLGIRPLSPNMVVAGPAFTVVGRRDPRPDDEYQPEKLKDFAMLEAIEPHSVVVINAENSWPTGNWGELMSHAAQVRGATGVVIDGGIRDSSILRRMEDWPVFVRYTSMVESDKRWKVQDFQVPVVMSGTLTSQVRVNPGDWIFGDSDGVLVIPAHLAEEVLIKAEEIKAVEDKVREEVLSGAKFQEIFDKYRRF